MKRYNPIDKIWWVTGNTRDSLVKTEWIGHRSKDALLKCLRKPLKKTLFSFFLYQSSDLAKPVLMTLADLIDIGAVTNDVKNSSAHFKTRKKKLPSLG